MSRKSLAQMRPVYVIGVGWHRYQAPSETPYVQLGLTAVRQALADAGVPWDAVETSYVATARLGMASGRPMLSHLGRNENPIVHIENASASGSAAFRHACIEVASGMSDVGLVVGVDKVFPREIAFSQTGVEQLAAEEIVPFTRFALLASAYASRHGISLEDIAQVAVKNHRNGSLNLNAHRQAVRSLEEVLMRPISGSLTSLQCCPVDEGAAAVIVASEDAIRRLGVNTSRAVRVAASAGITQVVYEPGRDHDIELTGRVTAMAYEQCGVRPDELDVVELHDAFTVEELQYVEAMGICPTGQASRWLNEGRFNIGGQVAVSPSGGLIAMGHPVGPTGVGQIGELTLQLRGEAGARQHRKSRTGLAHMVGLGAVAYVHILRRD
ncbi:thiolase family protein [Variovorax sp. DT-64]|uniref:thiolase family protein n=1 Tax=Variovorax sp. DT-64 TaxID=3396160 RepID=UPI003F1C7598